MSTPLLTNDVLPPAPVHRFSVGQYHRMIDSGVLTEDDRVELLEGWILPKMPHNPPHDGTIFRIQMLLIKLLPESYLVRIQSSITLNDSEPEPDLAIAVGSSSQFVEEHPGPRDVPLVIEVAASSLAQDRGLKQRIYARARIPIYWIINLIDRQVEVYSAPKAGKSPGYRERQDYTAKQMVPVILDAKEMGRIRAEDMLP